MALYKLNGKRPDVGEGCFFAPGCFCVGEVYLGKNVNFWFNTVARGDVAPITIGDNVNVQDLVMLHVTDDIPLTIGKNVSIGHKATLHSCTIGDGCLVGMDSVILDNVEVGENCLIAAGSVLPPGKKYPAGSMIKGSPAVIARPLKPNEIEQYSQHYKSYLTTKDLYQNDPDFLKGPVS
jgi:carbonic anhydrase/acetyltransferase-like protein (isoleucine patch superfamily)